MVKEGHEQRGPVRGRLEAHMENINWPIFPFGCNIGPCKRMVGNKTESYRAFNTRPSILNIVNTC